MGVQIPNGKRHFFLGGGTGRPIVKYMDITVICAKTAEPIKMPFGYGLRWAPQITCFRWGSTGAKGRGMATNFWLSMCYNFGCMIASDMLFDSRGGFSGSSYPVKT